MPDFSRFLEVEFLGIPKNILTRRERGGETGVPLL